MVCCLKYIVKKAKDKILGKVKNSQVKSMCI